MKFYNHCNEQLYKEAKKIIDVENWHPNYKEYLLEKVEHRLEVGKLVRANRLEYIPFDVNDVDGIVTTISEMDN